MQARDHRSPSNSHVSAKSTKGGSPLRFCRPPNRTMLSPSKAIRLMARGGGPGVSIRFHISPSHCHVSARSSSSVAPPNRTTRSQVSAVAIPKNQRAGGPSVATRSQISPSHAQVPSCSPASPRPPNMMHRPRTGSNAISCPARAAGPVVATRTRVRPSHSQVSLRNSSSRFHPPNRTTLPRERSKHAAGSAHPSPGSRAASVQPSSPDTWIAPDAMSPSAPMPPASTISSRARS